MDYEVVPEDLVILLYGTCSSYQHYSITIDRPDDQEITLVNLDVDRTQQIDETHSIRRSGRSRENIYNEMRSILRRQEEDWTDPGEGGMVNPTKVIFGEVNEDVLEDPDPLKGEYEITIEILGEDMEMDYGEKETKLALLSEHSVSEPRNLGCEYEEGKVELEWDEPEEKEGGIRKYNIYRATTLDRYEYIGNVSEDRTEYVDELERRSGFYHGREGDILYYRVVAINEDDHYYMVNSRHKRNYHIHYRRESTSLEEVIHLSPEETEKSDMAYKWVLDYSSLSEEDFEDRVGMDSVEIKKMEGGDVFFYDINKVEEENGMKVYEYEGGFFSKGEVDMILEDGDVSSELNIEMKNSWCGFSGEIWAEETSGPGYEGLKIVEQSIHSEGRIRASLNNTFDFTYGGNGTHWQVSRDLDIGWTLDLHLHYEENQSWVLSKENTSPISGLGRISDYSGSIEANGTLRQDSDRIDEVRYKEKDVSKEISGESQYLYGLSAQGGRGAFSPLVGAGNIGYFLALDEGLNESLGSIERGRNDPFVIGFSTNCQRDEFSTEKLYRYQYMDPMALPGMGSFLGTGLKRADLANSRHLEVMVTQIIRSKMAEMEEEPEEGWEQWRENVTEEIHRTIVLENPWGIQQYNGIYRWDHYVYGGLVIEPLGYFASEPLSEDEIDSYHEDREKFFEDQIATEDVEEYDREILLIFISLLAVILFGVLIHTINKAKEQN